MPASSSESSRKPRDGASGNTYVFSESHPLVSAIVLGLTLACLAPMFTLTGDQAWLAPRWGHLFPVLCSLALIAEGCPGPILTLDSQQSP